MADNTNSNFTSYTETLEYLYQRLPMFQRVGAAAFKKDLGNTIALCKHLDNPQKKFRSIHVAGTNGKGSTSHMLAAMLQSAGYRTGLYTSPHLKEFTERIKVNGEEMSKDKVVDFVNRNRAPIEEISPSFFEVTVAMAFDHFASEEIDIAVIEVGLGGRLDSTNIIEPLLSVITSISYDHTDMLGETLPLIASEKAGIIKPNTPVVISNFQEEISDVFITKAGANGAEISFADQDIMIEDIEIGEELRLTAHFHDGKTLEHLTFDLNANYQLRNIPGVLSAWDKLNSLGLDINEKALREGLANTKSITGLKGRWQKLNNRPLTYCDTGHNADGMAHIVKQIGQYEFKRLHFVLGAVNDKDISKVLELLPKDAIYYFCQANIPRALPAELLAEQAKEAGLIGKIVADVNSAYREALSAATSDDFIFIGGSTFVVAELEKL